MNKDNDLPESVDDTTLQNNDDTLIVDTAMSRVNETKKIASSIPMSSWVLMEVALAVSVILIILRANDIVGYTWAVCSAPFVLSVVFVVLRRNGVIPDPQ